MSKWYRPSFHLPSHTLFISLSHTLFFLVLEWSLFTVSSSSKVRLNRRNYLFIYIYLLPLCFLQVEIIYFLKVFLFKMFVVNISRKILTIFCENCFKIWRSEKRKVLMKPNWWFGRATQIFILFIQFRSSSKSRREREKSNQILE